MVALPRVTLPTLTQDERLDHEDHTTDIDFSREGIRARWKAGYEDTRAVLSIAPWEKDVDPIEGFYLHELRRMAMPAA